MLATPRTQTSLRTSIESLPHSPFFSFMPFFRRKTWNAQVLQFDGDMSTSSYPELRLNKHYFIFHKKKKKNISVFIIYFYLSFLIFIFAFYRMLLTTFITFSLSFCFHLLSMPKFIPFSLSFCFPLHQNCTIFLFNLKLIKELFSLETWYKRICKLPIIFLFCWFF